MADDTTPDRDAPPADDTSPAAGARGTDRSSDAAAPRHETTGAAKKTGGAAKKTTTAAKKTGGAAKKTTTAKKTTAARKTGGSAKKTTGAAAKKTTAKPAARKITDAGTAAAATGEDATTPPSPPAPRTTAAPERTGHPDGPAARTAAPAGAWAEAAWDALRRPGQPPEDLAELAVAELGPRAAAWADWLTRTYPDATPDQLARLATWQATRRAWLLGAAEAVGPGATVRLPATALVRAVLVLRVAAAYGYDPTDPKRAFDLLHLLGLSEGAAWWPAGRSGLAVALLARFVGRKTLARAVRTVAAMGDEHDSLERLAHRAVRYYRGGMPE